MRGKKRREGSTGEDEDKVPGHINTKKEKKNTIFDILSFFFLNT